MMTNPVLTFRVADQFCAIHIDHVIEVAAMVELVKLQSDHAEVLGVVNRHGKSLVLLDMGLVLDKKSINIDIATLFIVVQFYGNELGLVVDEVIQVDYVEHIQPAPTNAHYVMGVFSRRRDLVQLIAVELLINTFLSQQIED